MPYIVKISVAPGPSTQSEYSHFAVLEVLPGVKKVSMIPLNRRLRDVKRIVRYWSPRYVGTTARSEGFLALQEARDLAHRLNKVEKSQAKRRETLARNRAAKQELIAAEQLAGLELAT